jgi:hypothetical protein
MGCSPHYFLKKNMARISISAEAENRKIAMANVSMASLPQLTGVKCKDRGD